MKTLKKVLKQLDQLPMPAKSRIVPAYTPVPRTRTNHIYVVSTAFAAFAILVGGYAFLASSKPDPDIDNTPFVSDSPTTTTFDTATEPGTNAPTPQRVPCENTRSMQVFQITHELDAPMSYGGDRQSYVDGTFVRRAEIGEEFTILGYTLRLENITVTDERGERGRGIGFHFSFPNGDSRAAQRAFFTTELIENVGTITSPTVAFVEALDNFEIGFTVGGEFQTRSGYASQHYHAHLTMYRSIEEVEWNDCGYDINDPDYNDKCNCSRRLVSDFEPHEIEAFVVDGKEFPVIWEEFTREQVMHMEFNRLRGRGSYYEGARIVSYYGDSDDDWDGPALLGVVNASELTATGEFVFPVRSGQITRGFGQGHGGIDIAAPEGTDILAAASGVVILSEYDYYSYGHIVMIQHDDGAQTLYAHCSELRVNEGERVEQGQVIALVGNTGRSTGPHLHFEVFTPTDDWYIYRDDAYYRVNPMDFFAE
jgi:hypothetical protein